MGKCMRVVSGRSGEAGVACCVVMPLFLGVCLFFGLFKEGEKGWLINLRVREGVR